MLLGRRALAQHVWGPVSCPGYWEETRKRSQGVDGTLVLLSNSNVLREVVVASQPLPVDSYLLSTFSAPDD